MGSDRRLSRALLRKSILRHRPAFHKVKICKIFKKYGKCKQHEKLRCPFLHVQHMSQIHSNKAMKDFRKGIKPPCVFFLRGKCLAVNCQFPHVNPSKTQINDETKEEKCLKGSKKRYFDNTQNCVTNSMNVPGHNEEKSVQDLPNPTENDLSVNTNEIEVAQIHNKEENGDDEVRIIFCSDINNVGSTRRDRIMSKIQNLKLRYGNTTGAPTFIPFK